MGPKVGLGVLEKRKLSCSYVSGIDPVPCNVMIYVLVILSLFVLLSLILRRLTMDKFPEADSLKRDRSSDFTISGISRGLVF